MSTKNDNTILKIVNGPSKFDLSYFFFSMNPNVRLEFTIEVKNSKSNEFTFKTGPFLKAERLNPSDGDSWIFDVMIDSWNDKSLVNMDLLYVRKEHIVRFIYSCKSRKGFIVSNLSTETVLIECPQQDLGMLIVNT